MEMTYRIAFAAVVLFRAAGAQNSAPSSHLYFSTSGGPADILINEVRIPLKAMNTYYETLGWGGNAGGYAGLQEHPNGRNFIFSIWDNASQRGPIKPVYTGHGTTTEGFGGEGTGLKSWSFKLPWENDAWYALATRAWAVGQDTYCGMWVRDGGSGAWRHLITMDVAAPQAWFQGSLDAFIEDWSATGASRRETHIRNPWRRKTTGAWEPLTKASYSVNQNDLASGGRSYNFRKNWDGGKRSDATGDFYYMIAGGAATVPTTTNPASLSIARPEIKPGYAPIALKGLVARALPGEKVELIWDRDSSSLPQFRYSLEAFADASFSGSPIVSLDRDFPDRGRDTLSLTGKSAGTLYGRLVLIDILDNRVPVPAFVYTAGSLAVRPGGSHPPRTTASGARITTAKSILGGAGWRRADGSRVSGIAAGSAAGAYYRPIVLSGPGVTAVP